MFRAAGQARGAFVACCASIAPRQFIIALQVHPLHSSMAEKFASRLIFTPELSNFHLSRRAESGEIGTRRCSME
jgi:hypothetical protein